MNFPEFSNYVANIVLRTAPVSRKPDMNAVVVQFIDDGGTPRRVVSIVCKDEVMLPQLQEEAHRILGTIK